MAQLQQRLAEKDLSLKMTEQALQQLVELGFDPSFGARPLKRAIQQWLENPLAQALLSGKYSPGAEIIVDIKEGEFSFN